MAGGPDPGMPAGVPRAGSMEFGVSQVVFQAVEPASVSASLLERRDAAFVPFEAPPDLILAGLSSFSGNAAGGGNELSRVLRTPQFETELDRVREQMRQDFDLDRTVSISVAGVSLGLSVVYVLWLIRGGVLVGSYLSALPAWRFLDPLPVLSRVSDAEEEDDEDEALDAHADKPGDALRGMP